MRLAEVCVCYVLRTGPHGPEVLLGRKLRGIGIGRLVGPGGKLESGETPERAVVREVLEETGLTIDPSALQRRGLIRYDFPHRLSWSQSSWVFVAESFSGTVADSNELELAWVPVSEIPYERMWDDARLWLPGVLAGGTHDGAYEFGFDLATVTHRDGRPLPAHEVTPPREDP